MKTFTVTCHYGGNYGALLQAYALQRTIEALGHENTVVDYEHDPCLYQKIPFSSPKRAVRAAYLNWLLLCRRRKVYALRESFEQFHKKPMKLSRRYRTVLDLRKDPPQAECLIAGSDQIWNMYAKPETKSIFFLDFGSESQKRISYAASMERLDCTEEQKAQMVQWLSRFDAISLREESARRYVEHITGRSAEWVLDPVFLQKAEEWGQIAIPPRIRGPYILCYQVQGNERMQETVDLLKKQTGYPIVSICNSQIKWIRSDITLFDVSPEEFLGFYQNAAIVVSASFHGTAFGLVFGKPTYGLVRSSHANRIREVLERFGLGQFCIDSKASIPPPQIDRDTLAQQIAIQREHSLHYLKTHLKDNDDKNENKIKKT